jgi:thiol-disulfide isomerase/thioredoxin
VASSPTENVGRDVEIYRSGWKTILRWIQEGLSWSGLEQNCVFLNLDGQRFADISGASGLDFPDDARAAALVDWDFDGKLDLWLANRTAPQLRFLHNEGTPDGSFLALRLRGTSVNRDGIGARVELELEGGPHRRLIQTLHAGDGYLSQSSAWLHFGLGAASAIERVTVRWPGAASEEFRGCAPGGRYELVQGSGEARPWTPPARPAGFVPSTTRVTPPSERARLVLAERLPLPELEALGAGQGGEQPVPLLNGAGPVLVNVWASWCQPCRAELTEFRERADELRQRLRVIALTADEPAARADARRVLEELDWPFEVRSATPELLDTLDVLQRSLVLRRRRLPLPTSFLINARRELVAVYKGPVGVDTVLADLPLCEAGLDELRTAASPFRGRWVARPESQGAAAGKVMKELYERGLAREAAAFFLLIPAPPFEDERHRDDYVGDLVRMSREVSERSDHALAARLLERALEIRPDDARLGESLAQARRAAGGAR